MGVLRKLGRSAPVVALLLAAMVTQSMADLAADAKSLYKNVLGPHLGSKDSVNRNLTTPLVGGSELKSASGQTSFESKAFKASGSPFMRVSAFLNMPTGDLTGITVEQDLDLDGTIESVSVFPRSAGGRLISTGCSDGYVQCNPGTFENCQFRKWTAESSGKIGVVVAGAADASESRGVINALSGCFCFNNACSRQNNSAIINLSGVVSDIAGGIASAVLAVRKDVAITSIQNAEGGTVTYYGVKTDTVRGGEKTLMTAQQAAAMPNMPSSDLVNIQDLYRDSPGAISGVGEATKDTQVNDPSSLFNSVSGAMIRQAGQRYTCTNQRNAWLDLKNYVQTIEHSGSGAPLTGTLCTDHYVNSVLAVDAQGQISIGWQDTNPGGSLGVNCGPVPYNAALGTNGHFVGTVTVSPPAESAGFKMKKVTSIMTLWGGGCTNGSGDLTWIDSMTGPLVGRSSIVCPSSDAQWPNYSFGLNVEFDSQDLREDVTPSCRQYEERSDCRLQQETWDGRPVYLNYLPTGFRMYQMCKDLSGPLRNTRICRDWWKQDKVFICQNTPVSYDFSAIQQRTKEIQSSASMPSSDAMICSDKGSVLNFQIPNKGTLSSCQQVCKTKVPFTATTVTTAGIRSDIQVDTSFEEDSWKVYYKDCDETSTGAFECPVDSSQGEVVVRGCACGNDFGEALGALTAINQAVKDSVCSQN